MTNTRLKDLAARYLNKSVDTLAEEEQRVLRQIAEHRPTSRDAGAVAEEQATFGDRTADKVAAFGGSWTFIILFSVVLAGWMLLNSGALAWLGLSFDPYPFIFLNLILSTIAAIQAPIIMMSQNRQADKDRVAAGLDYEVNLRAEIEILRLHAKIDDVILARLDAMSAQQEALIAEVRALTAQQPGSAPETRG
uniref:DUF1003 domain-containing protein n=1 Tax=Paenirhodobacter enshiensis TaxID=1105367 RepID=UPI0035B059A9